MTLYRLYKDNKRLQVGKDARARALYPPIEQLYVCMVSGLYMYIPA